MGWIVVPKRLPKSKLLVAVNMTLYGSNIFADVIRVRILRWCHPGFRVDSKSIWGNVILDLGWALNPKTSVLLRDKTGERTTRKATRPHEDRGRDWNDASTSQQTPRIAGNHRKLVQRHGKGSSSKLAEETNPVDTLILDFWPLVLWKNTFLLF